MTLDFELLDDEPPPPRKRHRWSGFIERHLPFVVIYLMVATLVGFLIVPDVIVTVPSGHVGLLWKRFRGGTQLNPRWLKEEGLRTLFPWDKLFIYDLRLQATTDSYNAISKDGVNLNVTINTRFRLKHDAIPQLHQRIGPNYLSLLVRPEIGNRAREIIAEYPAEEVYSTKRQEIQKRIRTHAEEMLGQSMMVRQRDESEYGQHYRIPLSDVLYLYDTLILGIVLPSPIVAAIDRKLEQYYAVQEYNFRVDREKKESERKQIEAQGIRAFQQIVSQGISESYLRWRGVEATLELAKSRNAKIVIIGNAKDGLPIILGNVDTPAVSKAIGPEPQKGNERDGRGPFPSSPPHVSGPLSPPHISAPSPQDDTLRSPPVPGDTPLRQGEPSERQSLPPPGKQSSMTPGDRQSAWPSLLSEVGGLMSRIMPSEAPAPATTHQQPQQGSGERPR